MALLLEDQRTEFQTRVAAILGARADHIIWCSICGRWSPAVDDWQRRELERRGWRDGRCHRCRWIAQAA